jgi:hypothetical protein
MPYYGLKRKVTGLKGFMFEGAGYSLKENNH